MEKDLEEYFINLLEAEGFSYCSDIKTKEALNNNFRVIFNNRNKVNLSDNEFTRLLDELVNRDVPHNFRLLRSKEHEFIRDDETSLYYNLFDCENWCANQFEVVNQLQINNSYSFDRYDVIILINGLPMVQVELKNGHVNPKRAIEQIVNTYKSNSHASYYHSLMCFVQFFIASNGRSTFYFANNNLEHLKLAENEEFLPISHWAKNTNEKIDNLAEFTGSFLQKCFLGETIANYMVLNEYEQKILIMRPYQIYAVKHIVDIVKHSQNNGYVWHTTGSGKTLTSFKVATLIKNIPQVDKCLFVVDRKDLDEQTRIEFNKFQPDCVDFTYNSGNLVNKLLSNDDDDKIIITTIQKLGRALKDNIYKKQLEVIKNKRMVFIFDECHRSQFGESHSNIDNFFDNKQFFGFTGTPIYVENSTKESKTTELVFKQELHSYTIPNAIDDSNVLKFRIDYFAPSNKTSVVNKILEMHDSQTRDRAFNALFATSSISDAIEYYHVFQKVQDEKVIADKEYKKLNIACVFSPPADAIENNDSKNLLEDLDQEKEDWKENKDSKQASMKEIIDNYNQQYNTNFTMGQFSAYYSNIQKRVKDHHYFINETRNKRIDILIVVDMMLTGFDSKYLGVLYVDKNLKQHGLIQAFSRTNRVLNITKQHGNIIVFRDLLSKVDEAFELFSNGGDGGDAWITEPSAVVIDQYKTVVNSFKELFTKNGLDVSPSQVSNLKGERARVEFVSKLSELLEFDEKLRAYRYKIQEEGTREELQAIDDNFDRNLLREYQAVSLSILGEYRYPKEKEENEDHTSTDDTEEPYIQLVLWRRDYIDYDYIMDLLARSDKSKEEKEEIINASPKYHGNEAMLEAAGHNFANKAEAVAFYKKNKQELLEANLAKIMSDYKLDGVVSELEEIMRHVSLDHELDKRYKPKGGWHDEANKKWRDDRKIIVQKLQKLAEKESNDKY